VSAGGGNDRMNNLMYKVTGWGLLALVWAWFTLEWLPSYAHTVQYGILGGVDSLGWIQKPAELHPIVQLATDSPGYTFLAGVLVVAWCYFRGNKFENLSCPDQAPCRLSDVTPTPQSVEPGHCSKRH
jgi:hypothetical protein